MTVTNKKSGTAPSKRSRYWSAEVLEKSDALDLERGLFTLQSPRRIAVSLKHSAERSKRRKSTPYRSAMSMLNFYINRAGKTLSRSQRRKLERAKQELRTLFKKTPPRKGHGSF